MGGVDAREWAVDRWRDVRGERFVVIDGVTASVEPVDAALPDAPAEWAVDGLPARAWATTWRAPAQPAPAAEGCTGPPEGAGAAGTLVLAVPGERAVARVAVHAGLPGDDPRRLSQWRPTALELSWADGTCDRVELADDPGPQRFPVGPHAATQVAVTVVDAVAPKSGSGQVLSISEVTLEAER